MFRRFRPGMHLTLEERRSGFGCTLEGQGSGLGIDEVHKLPEASDGLPLKAELQARQVG